MDSYYDKREQRIRELELELNLLKTSRNQNNNKEESEMKPVFKDQSYNKCDLENVEIEKYSRQMILTEIGADGMYSTRFK